VAQVLTLRPMLFPVVQVKNLHPMLFPVVQVKNPHPVQATSRGADSQRSSTCTDYQRLFVLCFL
jgi:hypothetical protein